MTLTEHRLLYLLWIDEALRCVMTTRLRAFHRASSAWTLEEIFTREG